MSEQERAVEAEKIRKETLGIVRELQALAPGDWSDITPDQYGGAVELPDGKYGTQFSYDSHRSPLPREKMDELQVQAKALLKKHGLDVVFREDGGKAYGQETVGFGPSKMVFTFGTGAGAITVSGDSRQFSDPDGKYQ